MIFCLLVSLKVKLNYFLGVFVFLKSKIWRSQKFLERSSGLSLMAHDVEKEENENSEKNIEKIPKSIEVILHKKSKKSFKMKIKCQFNWIEILIRLNTFWIILKLLLWAFTSTYSHTNQTGLTSVLKQCLLGKHTLPKHLLEKMQVNYILNIYLGHYFNLIQFCSHQFIP